MTQRKGKVSSFFREISFYTTALTCLVIPLSTSLISIFSGLTVLCWLLSGKVLDFPKTLIRHPQAAISFFLAVLFCLGLIYTPVSLEEGIDCLRKYRELLFIPIVLSIFFQKPKEAQFSLNAFLCGLIILLLYSYAIHFRLLSTTHFGDSPIFHITHSFFMAVLSFFAIHRALLSKQYKFFWLVIFILATINLFLISPGRTGMFVYIILAFLLLVQKLSWKKFIPGFACIIILAGGLYMGSDNVSTRVDEAVKEIQHYKRGKSKTSLGQRFDWYHNSIDLIKAKPIIGHGTGSFETVQKQVMKQFTTPTDNPHNEYLFIGAQLGLIGLLTYLTLLLTQLLCSLQLNQQSRHLAQGVVISMAAGCLMNSFLFDSMQGHYYAFIIAVCCSMEHQQHNTITITR